MSTPTALVPIADGSEEVETTTIIDVLIRGGVMVTTASVGKKADNILKLAHGLKLQADQPIEKCTGQAFDLIALPGGLPGADNLRDCKELIDLLKQQKQQNKWYAAICASPAVVLNTHGLLQESATAYPGFDKDFKNCKYSTNNVVVSGKCVTSKGPATAMEFALKLVEVLTTKENATTVANGLLFKA